MIDTINCYCNKYYLLEWQIFLIMPSNGN